MRSQMRVPYLLLFSRHMVGLPQDFPVENTRALRAGSNANLLPTSSFEGQWTSNRVIGKCAIPASFNLGKLDVN